MVKPFLLKVHPDVQPNASAKQVNLAAIQNLNSYLDVLQTMADGKYNSKQHHRSDDDHSAIAEIDFVLQLEAGRRGIQQKSQQHHTSASRRRVELLLPPVALCQQLAGIRTANVPQQSLRHQLSRHGTHELTKLLRVAGLPAPSTSVMMTEEEALQEEFRSLLHEDDDPNSGSQQQQQPAPSMEEGLGRAHFQYRRTADRRSNYEKSRDRFTANIQWQHYDRLYNEALQAAEAEWATEDLYEKNPGARRKLVARILARIRIADDSNIAFEEQLVAFRRLSILLETHFHFLQLDRLGRLWETAHIVLTPARDYNLSPSALRKRRLKQGHADSGFCFQMHADNRVTIYIPLDFGDEELLQEIDRNVWDLYDWHHADGMEDLFPDGAASYGLRYEPDIESPRLIMHQEAIAQGKNDY